MLPCRPAAEEASGSGEGAGGKGEVVVAKDGSAKEPEKPAAQSNEERQAAANAAQKEALLAALGKLTVRGRAQSLGMQLLAACTAGRLLSRCETCDPASGLFCVSAFPRA